MVLTALMRRASHGYGLARAIEESAGDGFRVRPGNLYRVLDRLCDVGLVEEVDTPAAPSGGADRGKCFSITRAGRDRITLEIERLSRAISGSPRLVRAFDRGLGRSFRRLEHNLGGEAEESGG